MTTRDEKTRRRHIIRAIRAGEQAASEAARPLDKRTLRDLLTYLEATLLVRLENGEVATRCDHTFLHTKDYLIGLDVWDDTLPDWFGEYGGFCDCEVMFNVFDYWTPQRLSE